MARRTDPTIAALVAFTSAAVGLAVEWVEQYLWIKQVNEALGSAGLSIGDIDMMIPPIVSNALLCAGIGALVYVVATSRRLARVRNGRALALAVVFVWLAVCAVGQSLGWAAAPWPGWFEAATSDYAPASYGLWEMGSVLLAAVVGTVFATLRRQRSDDRPSSSASHNQARTRALQAPKDAVTQGRVRADIVAGVLTVVLLAAAWFTGLPVAYLVLAALTSIAGLVATWPAELAIASRGKRKAAPSTLEAFPAVPISVGVLVVLAGLCIQVGACVNATPALPLVPAVALATLAPVPLCWSTRIADGLFARR